MLFPVWFGAGVLTLIAVGWIQRRRAHQELVTRLRAQWGHLRERDRDLTAIASYQAALAAEDPGGWLDDRTWEDLNLDSIFEVVDRTESALGQQALYARLRTAPLGRHLEAFDALMARFEDSDRRERAQIALARLAGSSAFDLWRLTQPNALVQAPWHALFPMLGGAMLAALVAVPFFPAAILVIAAGTMLNLFLRGAIATRLSSVTGAFRQVGPLVAAAKALEDLHGEDTASLTGNLQADSARLSRLRQIANWAGRDSAGAGYGDLPALLFEYLNLLLFLDANALFFGARELAARGLELGRVIAAVGDIDAALSVASYRAGTPGWTRPVRTEPGTPMRLEAVRHPLLPDAVPNTVSLGPPHGMIVTGSNMSGKSTFLRTIGANAVMAQTINTCLASTYQAPAFVVRSCIGRADDPATGRSYYLMEVDAVLDLVRAAAGTTPHLMLFDELFRGTNAVERIAAGEAVLAALVAGARTGQTSHIVIAATHDQELVDLLSAQYAPFHFTDRVDHDGLVFDYELRPGPATTRNAIALLRMRGAPADLVERALGRAAELDHARATAR
jgi:hypothetical protein